MNDDPYAPFRPRNAAADETLSSSAGSSDSAEAEYPHDEPPYRPLRPVGLPRSAWLWLAGIVLSLISMLAITWRAQADPVSKDDDGLPASGLAVRIPEAPQIGEPPSPSRQELPPLPEMPSPMAPLPTYPNVPAPLPFEMQVDTAKLEAPVAEPSLDQRRSGMPRAAAALADGSSEQSSADRYIEAMTAALPSATDTSSQTVPSTARTTAAASTLQDGVRRLQNPSRTLVQGTQIACVLERRLVTDHDGPVTCRVAAPVRSMDGRAELVPVGARLFGRYRGVDVRQSRVSIEWNRLLTPQGISMDLHAPGLDADGAAGVTGVRNAHWPSRIMGPLMVSLLGDAFKYLAATQGPSQTTAFAGTVVESPFESNTANTLQSLAGQAVQVASEMKVSVSIPQGTALTVYVDRDVDLSGVLP